MLGGRDLQRSVHGTWLGITKQGRLAVLTNFREDGPINPEAISRGAIVNMFLTQDVEHIDSTDEFIPKLMDGGCLTGVGGFSLVCGKVGERLAVVSNRTSREGGPIWILRERGETVGLSNAAFADDSWPKVTRGKRLLSEAIERDLVQKNSKVAFIEILFEILNDDTLPRNKLGSNNWESQVQELRNSIFIPAVGGEATEEQVPTDIGAGKSTRTLHDGNALPLSKEQGYEYIGQYGTQKQTVVLVDLEGHVTFQEETLYGANGTHSKNNRDKSFDFNIDGWERIDKQ